MRRTLLILLAVSGILSSPHAVGAAEVPVPSGEPRPLPALAFRAMDGTKTTLAALTGKVVVLNLWATWCAPCLEEMPSLDRLQARFEDQPVVVLALSVDRASPERVRAFLDEVGVRHLQTYRDPKAAAIRTLKVPGLPATILVDKEGREAGRVLGIARWDGPQAVEAVQRLLDGSAR